MPAPDVYNQLPKIIRGVKFTDEDEVIANTVDVPVAVRQRPPYTRRSKRGFVETISIRQLVRRPAAKRISGALCTRRKTSEFGGSGWRSESECASPRQCGYADSTGSETTVAISFGT